jgi:hypothetical protein
MSSIAHTPQSSKILFPQVIFNDNPFRALKMYIRQYYLSSSKNDIYMIKCDNRWHKVPREMWYNSLLAIAGDIDITPILPLIDNDEACRRIRPL